MATYKGIQGYSVQKLSGDPTASSDTEGQLFYNSGSGKFKITAGGAGAWASGGDVNTVRYYGAGAGLQTAALFAGGDSPTQPPVPTTIVTESYNGSAWTEVNDMTDGLVKRAPFGTSTSMMVAGGDPGAVTDAESWDGTSWTAAPALNTGGRQRGGYGASNTQGGAVDGRGGPPTNTYMKVHEEFNGTAWAEAADTNTGRSGSFTTGKSSSAAICTGGFTPSLTALSETWNGTSWSEGNNINTARADGAAAGPSTAALSFGGDGPSDKTESYDGTSWTEVADLATSRTLLSGAGLNNTSALAIAGLPSSPTVGTTATEEWNDPVYSIKTVTVS